MKENKEVKPAGKILRVKAYCYEITSEAPSKKTQNSVVSFSLDVGSKKSYANTFQVLVPSEVSEGMLGQTFEVVIKPTDKK